MRLFTYIIFLLLIQFGFQSVEAQRRYFFTEQWDIGLSVGSTTFNGDLSDKSNRFFSNTPFSKYFYQDRKSRAILIIDKQINLYFGVRGHISYGKINSTKESVKQYFTANLFEYSIMGTANFTNMIMGYDRYRPWNFYGYAGIGFTESRTWKYNMVTGDLVGTNGFGSPKYDGGKYIPMTETVFPIGLGFNYQFNKYFSMRAEMGLHYIKTDKLDATISEDVNLEGFGLISLGVNYHFALPDHWSAGARMPSYNGKSSDPALKSYNKKRRVVMQTKGYKSGMKAKKKYNTKNKRKLKRRR